MALEQISSDVARDGRDILRNRVNSLILGSRKARYV
jgi:hypothetical protein